MITRIAPPLGFAFAALALFLTACGGGDEVPDPTTSESEITVEPMAGPLDDSGIGLILLGPAGDWLYPRVADVDSEESDAMIEQYTAGLGEIRANLDESATIATGWITPPSRMRYESNFSGMPQSFLRAAEVDALVPSPIDLIRGADHIHSMATGIGCPVVATELRSPRINGSFDDVSHSQVNDDIALTAITQLASVRVIDLTDDFSAAGNVSRPHGARGATRIELNHSLAEEWSVDDDVLRLAIPDLESHQAAVIEITGLESDSLSVSTRIEDLLPPDAPLLNQPAVRSMTLGNEITQQAFERNVSRSLDFGNVAESIVFTRNIAGWPSEAQQGRVHLYELQSEGRVTHRLFAVKVEPGEDFIRSIFVIVCDPEWENPEVQWIYEPIVAATALTVDQLVDELVAEHGVSNLPEHAPEMLGAEVHWRAIRQGMSGAAILLEAISGDLAQ